MACSGAAGAPAAGRAAFPRAFPGAFPGAGPVAGTRCGRHGGPWARLAARAARVRAHITPARRSASLQNLLTTRGSPTAGHMNARARGWRGGWGRRAGPGAASYPFSLPSRSHGPGAWLRCSHSRAHTHTHTHCTGQRHRIAGTPRAGNAGGALTLHFTFAQALRAGRGRAHTQGGQGWAILVDGTTT